MTQIQKWPKLKNDPILTFFGDTFYIFVDNFDNSLLFRHLKEINNVLQKC